MYENQLGSFTLFDGFCDLTVWNQQKKWMVEKSYWFGGFHKSGYPKMLVYKERSYLVGGFNHLEKYFVNGKDYPIYYGK